MNVYTSLKLTVGFESNLQKNSERKEAKYAQLIREQSEHFKSVKICEHFNELSWRFCKGVFDIHGNA